jgi:hypothetical protein
MQKLTGLYKREIFFWEGTLSEEAVAEDVWERLRGAFSQRMPGEESLRE